MKPLHLLVLAALGWWLFRKDEPAAIAAPPTPGGVPIDDLPNPWDLAPGVIPTKTPPTVTGSAGSGVDWEELAASSPT